MSMEEIDKIHKLSLDKILSKRIYVAHWAIPLEPNRRERSRKSVTFSFLHKGPNHSGGQFSPDGLIKFNRLETVLQTLNTLRNGRGLKTP